MSEIKCDFLNCYAGMGVAGNGVCFLKGNPRALHCGKFKTTDKGMLEHAEAEIDNLRSRIIELEAENKRLNIIMFSD